MCYANEWMNQVDPTCEVFLPMAFGLAFAAVLCLGLFLDIAFPNALSDIKRLWQRMRA